MTEQLILTPALSSGPASPSSAGRRPAVAKRARLAVAGGAGLSTVFAGSAAFAQGSGGTGLTGVTGGEGPTAMLDAICSFILGPFGQTLAVLGIIGIGLAWMFGRVSLGLIAGVIGGIIIMFGASLSSPDHARGRHGRRLTGTMEERLEEDSMLYVAATRPALYAGRSSSGRWLRS